MDSDKGVKFVRGSQRMMVAAGVLLAALYMITAVVQILVSSDILDDPSGIFPEDIMSGFVMLVISVVFLGVVFTRSDKRSNPSSYFIVGAFLGTVHGLTDLLIAVSRLLSDIIGTEQDEDIMISFLDPSVILLILIVAISIFMIVHRKKERGGKI